MDLEGAKANRTVLKRSITRWHNRLRASGATEGLERNTAEGWIESLTDYDEIIGDDSQLHFEKICDIIKAMKKPVVRTEQPAPPISNHLTSQIKLPAFDGQAANFNEWISMFDALFNRDRLNPAERMLALRNLIGERGTTLIKNLPITEEGITIARDRLINFYGDPHKIREEVIQNLKRMNIVSKQSSNQQIRQQLITIEQCHKALTDANSGSVFIDGIAFREIASKVPEQLIQSYNRKNQNAKMETFIPFIREEYELMIRTNEMTGKTTNGSNNIARTNVNTITTQEIRRFTCAICSLGHKNVHCQSFTPQRRKEIVIEKNLCFRCLRRGHRKEVCTSLYICPCGQPHSKVICEANANRTRGSVTNNNNQAVITTTVTTTTPKQVISYHQTVLVYVNKQPVRVLLDSGAGHSIITNRLASRLGLPNCGNPNLNVGGLYGDPSSSKQLVEATLHSSFNNNMKLNVKLATVDNFNNLKLNCLSNEERTHLRNNGYDIADTQQPINVEIIIGVDYYYTIWLGLEIPTINNLFLRQSIFGWTVSGLSHANQAVLTPPTHIYTNLVSIMPTTEFWETEDLSKEEEKYVNKFIDEMVNYNEDKYEVKLPWLKPIEMKDNLRVSEHRLKRLICSLNARGILPQYSQEIQTMIESSAELAPATSTGPVYYMPHHGVSRPDKSTTKLRIVFDGSSHETDTKPLNDNLYKGITTWNSIKTLLKFRMGKVGIIADVEKAFLRVGVNIEDRDALRFLWINNNQQTIHYRFHSVPFGTSASPFLLFAAITKLIKTHGNQFTDITPLIQMYVDDLVISIDTNSSSYLLHVQERIVELFRLANMNMRKWRCSERLIDQRWSPGGDPNVKVLGYCWNVINDSLSIATVDHNLDLNTLTKRKLASFLSSIYDPLGLVSPFTIKLRLLMRELWKQQLDWDQLVPNDIATNAREVIRDVARLSDLVVPRNAKLEDSTTLHVFCDASQLAFGSAAYIGSSRLDSPKRLLTARVKLSKNRTIPELELDALMMAAEMARKLHTLGACLDVIIYSDSLINLQRLKKHPNDQTASIALKINQIKSCVNAKYRHIPTKCNIADVLSRGTTLTNLISLDPWWVGPIIPEESRFILDTHEHTQIIAVTRIDNARVCPCVKVASYGILLNVFTNIAKILKRVPRYSALDPHDISLTLAIRHVQRSHFQHEIDALEANQSMDRGSVLRNYHCIIDPDGILRLETRLRPTGILSMNQVRPIIFPSGCHITEILIRYYHVSNYHCGMDRTISIIRDRYFIIGLRRSVKKLVNQCRICILKRRKAIEMSHGQVPPFRYDNTHPPFFNTGIDLFGPLKVKFTTPGKRYGVIFCCATTRAVHLETINGLTSEMVFQALRRFIARRGLPGLIYSDNGTQLVSIKKKLTQALHSIQQQRPDLELNLKWLHLTASSPWRGGFYERLIRIIKDSLIGITYRSTITDEDLATSIVEIESFINSRPLFVHENETITPSHFFRGTSLRTIPPVSRETRGCIAPTDLIQDYLRSRRHVNAIWRTWKNAYLLQLRNFHINRGPESTWNLVTGDTVYVKTPGNLDTWPLGRIVHTYPSRDCATRTVDVQYYDRRRLVTKTKDVRTVIPLECANQPHQ